jgi:signal transduction histidine kinase
VVLASARRTAWALSGVALLCLGLAIIAAIRVGRRISTPIGHLVDQIPTLGEGRPIEIRTGIQEVQELAGAMRTVSAAISERQRLSELERKVLADSDRSKDEFLAMLSHELRNPLAGAHQRRDRAAPRAAGRGCAQGAAGDRAPDEADGPPGRGSARRQPHHARQGEPALRAVELSALVRDALRTSQQAAKLAHHEIDTDLAPAWVSGDRARLEQVVVNLLGNAIKFTPAGKRILLSVREADGVASIAVTDAGIGIPKDELARVFELFVQGPQDMSRARGGMGVGLAIVKRLVELHGGQVTAASAGPERARRSR